MEHLLKHADGYYYHPTACIDSPCRIGAGTKIWHFCHVMAGAVAGRDCVLGQNVMLAAGSTLGDRVKVQNNVSIYTGVHCGDGVFLGPSCVFTNVDIPRAFLDRKSEYRPTQVGEGATVGANATVVCGHAIGAFAFIGAGAVVTCDAPPHALMLGVPARPAGWVCRCGRRLEERGECLRCPGCGSLWQRENQTIREI